VTPFPVFIAGFRPGHRGWFLGIWLILGFTVFTAQAGSKAKPAINQELKNEGFTHLFETVFTSWDKNHDGKLDLWELNVVIENPQIHGNESAIAAVLRRRLQPDEADEGGHKSLSREQVMAMADDPQIQKVITRHAWHIQAINHALFLTTDPNLETFHQGGMGDCYLLAVIGAYVYHHPLSVRAMIQPQANGGFEVHFGNGRIVPVDPLTDAELLMGAAEGKDHGIWLSVLEKAYARINEEAREMKTGEEIDADEAVYTDLIGHGGYYGPVISRLTGHRTSGAPIGKWLKENPQTGYRKLHELLTKLAVEHRLMATGTRGGKPLPKGIAHGHVYAVLSYNPSTQLVLMFNPWGNHVKPANPPGLLNGYLTEHGMFQVPLVDFNELFAGFTYETDKPVKQ